MSEQTLRGHAKAILDNIEVAEKIHPAGSREHQLIMGAALQAQWPLIRSVLYQIANT